MADQLNEVALEQAKKMFDVITNPPSFSSGDTVILNPELSTNYRFPNMNNPAVFVKYINPINSYDRVDADNIGDPIQQMDCIVLVALANKEKVIPYLSDSRLLTKVI